LKKSEELLVFLIKSFLTCNSELDYLSGQENLLRTRRKLMNRKLILNLLSSSSIFVSLMSTLAAIHPAHAAPS